MDHRQLSKQMDYETAATEIAMFQKALEDAYRARKVRYDSTINPIVLSFAQSVIFERITHAPSEAEVQED